MSEPLNIGRLNGFKLLENLSLVVPGPDQIVARTFVERLFTLPWHPFQKTKVIKTMIPDPEVYCTQTNKAADIFGGHTIIGHPQTLRRLALKLKEQTP